MVGTQSFTENEAWVKQSDLFGANKIYLLAKTITYSQTSLNSYAPITKVDPTVQTGETNVGDSANLNRRKGFNNYNGLNALAVNVGGTIDLHNLGSVGVGLNTITPGLLYTMVANGHKQYRFFDGRVGSAWAADPDPMSAVQKPYNSTDGIPVVIVNYTISAGKSENILNYNIIFREDKE